MSVRKARPAFGAPVTAGMSLRDIAAALGVSTALSPKLPFHMRILV